MNITNQLGQLTELWCQINFCERGIVLSQPTNPSSRYDFVAEIDNHLYRIQCKTAHAEDNDRISIKVASTSSKEKHNYLEEIDYFYTHWNDRGYLLPIELCTENNKEKMIRLGNKSQYSANNINAIYGKDYEIDVVLSRISGKNYEIASIESSDRRENKTDKEKNKLSNKCIDCGKPIGMHAFRCEECHKKHIHPLDMPAREELKKQIREFSFIKIGEMYGRSDNAVRKWCDYYSLPKRTAEIKKITDDDWEHI